MPTLQKTLPLLIGALLVASGACADDAKPQGGVSRDLEQQFKALDRNGDGYLSRDEVAESMKSGFEAADKNRDGKLDMAEFQALEANTSPDKSLGSVPATGATAPR